MAINTAARRRSASNLSVYPLAPGVTPDATHALTWRQQAGYGYSGIGAGEPSEVVPFSRLALLGMGGWMLPFLLGGLALMRLTLTTSGLIPLNNPQTNARAFQSVTASRLSQPHIAVTADAPRSSLGQPQQPPMRIAERHHERQRAARTARETIYRNSHIDRQVLRRGKTEGDSLVNVIAIYQTLDTHCSTLSLWKTAVSGGEGLRGNALQRLNLAASKAAGRPGGGRGVSRSRKWRLYRVHEVDREALTDAVRAGQEARRC